MTSTTWPNGTALHRDLESARSRLTLQDDRLEVLTHMRGEIFFDRGKQEICSRLFQGLRVQIIITY